MQAIDGGAESKIFDPGVAAEDEDIFRLSMPSC